MLRQSQQKKGPDLHILLKQQWEKHTPAWRESVLMVALPQDNECME